MSWELIYLLEVEGYYNKLSHRQQLMTDKILKRVKVNLLLSNEGGYGKALGHKLGSYKRTYSGRIALRRHLML